MRGRIRRRLFLSALVTSLIGTLAPTEYRSPLIIEKGPMRYVFEEWDEEDYGLKTWSTCYQRFANKTFLKHGTDTHPLTALLFGKSDFTLSQALPNSYSDKFTQFYNPFLSVINMKPRISYEEEGLSIGARFAYPICKHGRIGVRGQIPFRKIDIERLDHGDADTNQLKDVYTKEIVDIINPNATPAEDILEKIAYAIRLDFLESLYYESERTSIINYTPSPAAAVKMLGNAANDVGDNRYGAIIYSPEGVTPNPGTGDKLGVHGNDTTLGNLPSDGGIVDQKQYQFATGTDYKSLSVDLAVSAADKLAAQQRASKLWFTSAHINTALDTIDNKLTSQANKLFGIMDDYFLAPFDENTFSWLEDHGLEFDSDIRTGIGDIDLDVFYEHRFSNEFMGEVFIGVRLPTGTDDDYCGNPYRSHLGNGEHWEIRGGGLIAWQPLSWMNAKLDASYSFVLKGDENRPAAFAGAMIKNLGPCTSAEVDWSYLTAHLDFNFFHPKTDAISSVIGYELYYKVRDHINFKNSSMESWLGKVFNPTTKTWVSNPKDLSSTVAEMNSEAIAHKLRFEGSFRITKWFEIFGGGAYTFAGQNVPCEMDCDAGFVVTF